MNPYVLTYYNGVFCIEIIMYAHKPKTYFSFIDFFKKTALSFVKHS